MDRIKNVVLQVSNRMGVASSAQEDCEAPRHTEHTAVDSMHQKQQTQSRSESLPQGSVCTGTTDIADTRIWKPEPAPRSKPVPSGSISYESPSNEHVKEAKSTSPLQEVEQKNRHLQRSLDEAAQPIQYWQQEAVQRERERDSVIARAEALQKELNTVRTQADFLMKDHNNLKALLETSRQELQDAQRFMGTADTIAESELVQQVRDLNTEIFNLAQSMSDAQLRTGHERVRTQQQAAEAALRNARILEDQFLEILISTDPHGDTVLLQIAMQAAASKYLSRMISTWTYDERGDGFFESVYMIIWRLESQSVAGQWRALTRKSAEDKYLSRALREGHFKGELTALLVHVATLSGVRFSTTAHARAMELMVTKAVKIRHLIGEAMVSSDYEVVVPHAGTSFTTAAMEDVFKPRGSSRRDAGASVLCCTSLGLRRVEKVEGEVRAATLVKSEVGLDTLLEDLGLSVDVDDDGMSISSESV
ncbi:hypothetical protein FOMPIDRAFT_1060244 [Fomitopsis schrenkii]|uniref:Uncharacterized protein n=1 Tax=Fomitopsis schrenkii TaxID=2126942 RepID=S8EBZ3_FOMSC|nr:hypothetical protein FOMPIDRAFT_1060244 [Fomitopsis schrenkii]